MTKKGTIAKKIGVVVAMTITVPKTATPHKKNVIKFHGVISSVICMSPLNRFTILPRGVVSKNDMGRRTILAKSRSWRTLEALTAANTIVT